MLLCILGPKKSGKGTLKKYLMSKNYEVCEFDTLLLDKILDEKRWNDNLVLILRNAEDWLSLKKVTFTKLLILQVPSKSNWRCENDDEFNKTLFEYKQDEHIEEFFEISNYYDIPTFYKNFDKMVFDDRVSWDSYFMNVTVAVAKRSNCMKRKVGAIVVKNKRIVATGYNGTASGMVNCIEMGCTRCNNNTSVGYGLDYCLCIHAEESAFLNSGYEKCCGGDIYITHFPCLLCYRKIVQMGIKRVCYKDSYSEGDVVTIKYFKDLGIDVCKIK